MTTRTSKQQVQEHAAVEPAGDAAPVLIERHPANPILTRDHIPFRTQCVFNSGAALVDGEIVMVLNVWDASWSSRFIVARSRDGVHFDVDGRSMIEPPREYPYQPDTGIFDTRITPREGAYYITYNTYADGAGGRIRMGRTEDFESFEDMGFITGADHRNCVIFPEKIDGAYVRLERPNGQNGLGEIFISFSPDLLHWGRTEILLQKGTRYWESLKIGPGAPPIRTEKGWLVIYHGCREHMNGIMYNMGCMLLDLADPSRIVGKLRDCLMWPETDYELAGNCPGVVFPTAAIPHGEPDELKIYYGAADTCIGLARASINGLVDRCLADGPVEYVYGG